MIYKKFRQIKPVSEDPAEVTIRHSRDGISLEAFYMDEIRFSSFEKTGKDCAVMRLAERTYPCSWVMQGRNFYFSIRGMNYVFEEIPSFADLRQETGRIDRQLKAQMPGRILAVLKNEGESFEAKEALLIMESMKMENKVLAVTAGCVKEVLVKPGNLVEAGQILMELDLE